MNNIIFDLEATCWEDSVKIDHYTESEIIEIGAVKLDDDFEVIDQFQTFVKPTQHPVISEYCTNLTSIKQEDVESAPDFHTAISNFEKWCGDNPLFMSWGDYDRNQITRECERKLYKGQMVKLVQNHKNIKWIISRHENVSRFGFGKAMKRFKLKFEGTPHRGIDDARNIARVAKMFKQILIA
jgi:inhibitor of KinA sporulation pathway (predicted exonuclease)